jgi:hypothetical protein
MGFLDVTAHAFRRLQPKPSRPARPRRLLAPHSFGADKGSEVRQQSRIAKEE